MFYVMALLSIPKNVPFQESFRFLLSTQNNLSCIYLDFGMIEEHKSSLQLLSGLIADLKRNSNGCDESAVSAAGNDPVNSRLFLNLMVLSRFHMLAAAA